MYNQLIKLRDILSIKMPCRISVLLQLEMTGPTIMTGFISSSFEFQGVNYHRMMVQRIYVCRLTINIDILLSSRGITLKIIGSATRYEFHGYHIRMINERQYVYKKTA